MLSKDCLHCCFGDKCKQEEPCENYYPIDQDAEDEFIYKLTQDSRIEYYSAWFEYISEYND